MGTVSDLLILSGFKREFSKYPKPARRLVSAAILVNVAGRAGSQAGERFTWPEAGDGALGGGDGTAGAPPDPFSREPRDAEAGRSSMHVSGGRFCQKQRVASGLAQGGGVPVVTAGAIIIGYSNHGAQCL